MAVESWKLLGKTYPTINNDPYYPWPPDRKGDAYNDPDHGWIIPDALVVCIVSGGDNLSGGLYQTGTAAHALHVLLKDTGWTLGTVDVTGTYDLETEKESTLTNIQEVQKIWGGMLVWEYVFDDNDKIVERKLHLRNEDTWQNYTGFQIRYAKNLKHITRSDNNDIVTRLYPFGENDLDIYAINDGKKYVENYSYTDSILFGVFKDQKIHDQQELKEKAEKALAKMCKPRRTYRIKMADLRTLPEYQHEDFQLGDIVDVIDEDLSINLQARVVRHRHNVFMPWQCELEIGEPEERLVTKLADAIDSANFIKDALKPNPTTSNLLKGFINTFTTRINSANGRLVWDDAALEAIEIDAQGNDTGNRVRITPGGIGISTDGGQTFATAVTGKGILANTIIVNELYAIATDDGYTKIKDSGLHVYDQNFAERLIAGWWMEGSTKRFGLNVKAADGTTTILDDRGILQTWQEGRADNLDSGNPLVLNIYLPAETISIKRAILRFKLLPFRAYSKSAASDGGSTITSATGGSASVTSGGGGAAVSSTTDGGSSNPTSGSSGVWNLYAIYIVEAMSQASDHNHGIPDGTDLARAGGGSVTFSASGSHTHIWTADHRHSVSIPGHAHTVSIPSHTHGVSIPSHYHSVNVPHHTHPITYGIYTSTLPSGVTIKINGVDRTSTLGGPFNSDQTNINISQYLSVGQWNTIELGTARLGRIDTTIFIQAMMGV
jgi:phage minor structural protein